MVKTVCIFIASAIASISNGITEQEAKNAAIALCQRIGMQFPSHVHAKWISSATSSPGWRILAGETLVVLDNYGRPRLALDMAKNDRIRKRRTPTVVFSNSESAIWSRAESISLLASCPSGLHRSRLSVGRNLANGEPPPNRKYVASFSERPFGFESYGNGNRFIATMDPIDGSVVSIEVEWDWTHQDPPVSRISTATALATAERVAGQSMNTSVVRLGYFNPSGGWGSARGARLRNAKQSVLTYAVSYLGGTVLIDARDGAVIGGGRYAGQIHQDPRHDQRVPPKAGYSPGSNLSFVGKLLAAFEYTDVPVPKAFKQRIAGEDVYYFNLNGRTSEVHWYQGIIQAGVFRITSGGKARKRPVLTRNDALVVLSGPLGVMNGKSLSIDKFEIRKGDPRWTPNYAKSVRLPPNFPNSRVVLVDGKITLGDSRKVHFWARFFADRERFISWSASFQK